MGNNINIHPSSVIEQPVEICDDVKVDAFSLIGVPPSKALPGNPSKEITKFRKNVSIGRYVTICNGANLKENVTIDDYCRVGQNTVIGENSFVLYGGQIFHQVKIGISSKISGFVSSRVIIGNHVTSMGTLVHKYSRPYDTWNSIEEPSPCIEDLVVIGMGAVIIGGITVGKNSYIAAGARVSVNVPPNSIVINTNIIIPKNNWKGSLSNEDWWLKGLPTYKNSKITANK